MCFTLIGPIYDDDDDDDDGDELPYVDHGPLNEGAVGKTGQKSSTLVVSFHIGDLSHLINAYLGFQKLLY